MTEQAAKKPRQMNDPRPLTTDELRLNIAMEVPGPYYEPVCKLADALDALREAVKGCGCLDFADDARCTTRYLCPACSDARDAAISSLTTPSDA